MRHDASLPVYPYDVPSSMKCQHQCWSALGARCQQVLWAIALTVPKRPSPAVRAGHTLGPRQPHAAAIGPQQAHLQRDAPDSTCRPLPGPPLISAHMGGVSRKPASAAAQAGQVESAVALWKRMRQEGAQSER